MLRIHCPFCGERDEVEFHYGGEMPGARPGLDVSDAEWSNYLFARENPKGVVQERWCHSYGCNQWFDVVRDSATHQIHRVEELPAAGGAEEEGANHTG